MIGSVARSQMRVVPALMEGEQTARAGVDDRIGAPRRTAAAQAQALDGAFVRGGRVIALHGPRDIHATIADFVRDNGATLSRCTAPEGVADVLVRSASEGPSNLAERAEATSRGRTSSERRWIALAASQSRARIRAQARAAALQAGLPVFAVDAVADGVARGAARVVVDVTVRRPLQQAYAEALTRRNAVIESTSNDGAAMRASDRLIHDLALSRFDLSRLDLGFTQAHIETASLGLPRAQFPFATANADTLARAAVLEAIAEDPSPCASDVKLLAAAAKLARDTAPDELELLSGGR